MYNVVPGLFRTINITPLTLLIIRTITRSHTSVDPYSEQIEHSYLFTLISNQLLHACTINNPHPLSI